MKKKPSLKKDNRSIRTFFLYTFIVLFVILTSLSIKAVSIARQSKFDGKNINIAVAQNDRATAILGFNFVKNSTSILKIKNKDIPVSAVGPKLGIIVEGKINSNSDLSNETPETILMNALFKDSAKTDLTIFDIGRLILSTKNVLSKDMQKEEIDHSMGEHDVDKIVATLFKDDKISSENVSIEIINATNEPGLGKRLERCLTNVGANVVAVSTPHSLAALSKIQYFGPQTYTVEKLNKILKFPTEKIDRKTIARIVIIIGEDNRSATRF